MNMFENVNELLDELDFMIMVIESYMGKKRGSLRMRAKI